MTEDATDATTGDESPESSEQEFDDTGELAAQVGAYDETLAEDVATLGNRLTTVEAERDALEAEVEELTDRVKRVQADFENYKKRAKRRQEEIEARATEDLVERLVEVRDNLRRALDQDADMGVREGVEATLREFDRVLDDEDVDEIDPDTGSDVDPHRHEVVHRESEDADAITGVYRPGYEMGEKVLRPAQVTVGTVDESGGEDDTEEETAAELDDSQDEPPQEDNSEADDGRAAGVGSTESRGDEEETEAK